MNLSEHFTREEMECPCCQRMELHPELLQRLERLRRTLDIPLPIVSGFRCQAHNSAVGGKNDSRHLTGEAVDIACHDDNMKYRVVQVAMFQAFGGIGIKEHMVHLDIRNIADHRLWTY